MNGKDICKELKSIRRSIARENHINLDIPECDFGGRCPGTCPRCEMEAKILEQKLAQRLTLGKIATVAGIALTLAGPVAASNSDQEPITTLPPVGLCSTPDSNYVFRFEILDDKDSEPVFYATIHVMKEGKTIAATRTDFDGRALIFLPDNDAYDIEISMVGYQKVTLSAQRPLPADGDMHYVPVKLSFNETLLGDVITVGMPVSRSFLDPTEGHTQHMEIEGVKVKAQY